MGQVISTRKTIIIITIIRVSHARRDSLDGIKAQKTYDNKG